MSSSGLTVVSGPGRGVGYKRLSSIFTAGSGLSVVAGDTYICDESGTNSEPNDPDTGTLAVVRAVAAGDLDTRAFLGTFVIATEAAAPGRPFRGSVEEYGVDAMKSQAGSAGDAATVNVGSANLTNTPAVGNPIVAYFLDSTAGTGPVHFNGTPGGFTAHAGT